MEISKPSHFIRVNTEMMEYLGVWEQFLIQFNGVSFWRKEGMIEADLKIPFDASGGKSLSIL